MSDLSIRRAVAADAPLILEFVKDLALYEREPNAVIATVEDFLRDGFGDEPLFHVFIADVRQNEGETVKPAGFALYFYQYTTWRGRPVLYLEDLFVRPEFRGLGVGRVLLRELAREAVARKCAGVKWLVLDWNVDAIAFYERLGARILKEWQTVRIDGDAMIALAEGT
ncbi:GNAT family N-acetyltransferase [Pendulispora brunnea]|uniref:GNAT family N-acetyltransferase n=1 Tax=Pendulispora brunnea TaxID=2905690 RepID=A0ABZ2K039_9BACT